MNIIVILVIVLLLFGGVGFYGHSTGWGGGLGMYGGGLGLVVLLIVLFLLLR